MYVGMYPHTYARTHKLDSGLLEQRESAVVTALLYYDHPQNQPSAVELPISNNLKT